MSPRPRDICPRMNNTGSLHGASRSGPVHGTNVHHRLPSGHWEVGSLGSDSRKPLATPASTPGPSALPADWHLQWPFSCSPSLNHAHLRGPRVSRVLMEERGAVTQHQTSAIPTTSAWPSGYLLSRLSQPWLGLRSARHQPLGVALSKRKATTRRHNHCAP